MPFSLIEGTTIGSTVVNGTPNTILYTGSTGLLANDSEFSYDGSVLKLGDATNYTTFTKDGGIDYSGTNIKKFTIRPNLIQTSTLAGGVPTEVFRGLNEGFSMPVWSTPANQYEQLSFRIRVPIRWDEVTDPQIGVMTTISGAEDVGDKFRFELSWQTTTCGGDTVMGETVSSVYSEQTIISGGSDAYTAYCIFFTLDADDATNHINTGDMLQCRLRRVAATSNEVSNEIIVWDWVSMWAVGTVYADWSIESNVTG